jgi:hypothetical protein
MEFLENFQFISFIVINLIIVNNYNLIIIIFRWFTTLLFLQIKKFKNGKDM